MAFAGKFKATLDDKFRVAVPKKLRDGAAESERDHFFMTLLPEGGVVLYTPSHWGRVGAAIHEAARKEPDQVKARKLLRAFFSNAHETHLDKQGRMLVPEELRTGAAIVKDVMFVGSGEYAELWALETWERNEAPLDETYQSANTLALSV